MKSHVYLLSHRNGRRFKIGKANDIIARARSFGLGEVEWIRSVGLEVESQDAARHLEWTLLRMFSRWRLSPAKVLDDAGVSDGATEWMQAECRQRLEQYLLQIIDLHPHKRISGEALHAQVEALLIPLRVASEKRKKRNQEKQQRDLGQATLRRAQTQASRALLAVSLSGARESFWRELQRHAENGSIVGLSAQEYGCSLVLLTEQPNERVWKAEMQDTDFCWPDGRGGLVSSIVEQSCDDARIRMVGLSDCFHTYWPAREVGESLLGGVASFLRSLVTVDCNELTRALRLHFYEDDEVHWRRNHCVVQAFIDDHLPTLQVRRASRMSAALL